jgi:hypothetical protein
VSATEGLLAMAGGPSVTHGRALPYLIRHNAKMKGQNKKEIKITKIADAIRRARVMYCPT